MDYFVRPLGVHISEVLLYFSRLLSLFDCDKPFPFLSLHTQNQLSSRPLEKNYIIQKCSAVDSVLHVLVLALCAIHALLREVTFIMDGWRGRDLRKFTEVRGGGL